MSSEFGRHVNDVSKELEIINFKVLQENHLEHDTKRGSAKHWISEDATSDERRKAKLKNLFLTFQKAMKVLFIGGTCIGVNPVTGILQKDLSKMRLFKMPSSLPALAFLIFFTTASFTTYSFIWIAPKWPALMKELINSKLDEYIDPNVIRRCNIACCGFMVMAIMEHVLSIVSRIARILECNDQVHVGEMFIKVTSPWLYELNVPYVVALGVIVQFLNIVSTATWNYADIFIVNMSLFLTSILQQINKKIAATASKNYVPASKWGELREDYTRATNLVKRFDDVLSGIVLITFANDLFFICMQLYNILSRGLCSAVGTYRLIIYSRYYIYPAYLAYSSVYLFVRFLSVALVAARIHSASMVPGPILFAVPATSYCKEVERFQNQVNDGVVVAFSGLHFFYITRDLVLTVGKRAYGLPDVLATAAPKPSKLLSENISSNHPCNNVCQDLPELDLEPVCMMFSRYKKGFQFFVNMCHARRAICKENVLWESHASIGSARPESYHELTENRPKPPQRCVSPCQ
ncbi:unnamed protein product [Spodoptera exigua]|nr:unnamed protein product [Spodoptera exigua]